MEIKKQNKMSIAVLITCHNRKDITLDCLDHLIKQEESECYKLKVYLVDDGSTDGTSKAVADNYPEVRIIKGDGNLYWCGGMRLAFGKAIKDKFDFYLWLNDDTLLYPNAIRILMNTHLYIKEKEGHEGIITGATQSPITGETTYGGQNTHGLLKLLSFNLISPNGKPQSCDVINGNCVLIPSAIAEKVGNLDEKFTHGIGDFDYALRAKEQGFTSWVTPDFIGTCSKNLRSGSRVDASIPIKERTKEMTSPTGLPPAREWMFFTRRHGGILWLIYWLRTAVRYLFPRLWIVLRSRNF